MRERISIATYLAARYRLLAKALCYRQWIKSDPMEAAKWRGYLRVTQHQLAALRAAERIPALAQGGGEYL
jgi:hypothetical protein